MPTKAQSKRAREDLMNRKGCPRVGLRETKLNLLIVNQKAHLRLKNTKQKHQQTTNNGNKIQQKRRTRNETKI